MVGEDFRLKWNDHHSVFFSSAEQLCRGDHLTDVTLSCGNREFSAHKLVLSVCSAYFSQLFTPKSPSSRVQNLAAIVYLKDVDPRHMELLLSYMYRGEIHVEEQELMGLLATAKGLQIRGLTDAEPEAKEVNQEVTTAGHKRSAKGGRRKSEDAKKFKEEPSPPSQQWQEPNTSNNTTFHDDDEQYNSQQNQELDGLDNIHMPGGEGPMIYEDQNASSTTKRSILMANKDNRLVGDGGVPVVSSAAAMAMAAASMLASTAAAGPVAAATAAGVGESSSSDGGGDVHTCNFCFRQFKYHMRLIEHLRTHTKEKPFNCKICGKSFTQKGSCSRHERTCFALKS